MPLAFMLVEKDAAICTVEEILYLLMRSCQGLLPKMVRSGLIPTTPDTEYIFPTLTP